MRCLRKHSDPLYWLCGAIYQTNNGYCGAICWIVLLCSLLLMCDVLNKYENIMLLVLSYIFQTVHSTANTGVV